MPAKRLYSAVHNIIEWLRICQKAKAQGYPVSHTTDPTWLIHMAINRRAGWPDDPSNTRGSAMPVHTRIVCTLIRSSRYPVKASGDRYQHLRLIAHEINTPRLIVRAARLGEWRQYLLARIPHRITTEVLDV